MRVKLYLSPLQLCLHSFPQLPIKHFLTFSDLCHAGIDLLRCVLDLFLQVQPEDPEACVPETLHPLWSHPDSGILLLQV